MATPRSFQTNTGLDTSKRLPCPAYDADPSSSALPVKCKGWSGLGIHDVTRHLRTHHAVCHELINNLSSSKLQPEERYQMYYSFFSSRKSCEELEAKHTIGGSIDAKSVDVQMESQIAQGQAHLLRNHQDNNLSDGLTPYKRQPGVQSHQGGSLPPQQILPDTMVNHSRSESAVRSTNAAPFNIDDPYTPAPGIDDGFPVPLNDPSFITGLHAHANDPCRLGLNESVAIPNTASNHQPQAWPNPPEGIPYSNRRGLALDIEQSSEVYTWGNSPYNTGALVQCLPGLYQATTNAITAQHMRQNMRTQIPQALKNQYRSQLSTSTTVGGSLQTRERSEVCYCQCHLVEHPSALCFVCQVYWKKAQCDCKGSQICCNCRSSVLPVAPQIQQSRSYDAVDDIESDL